MGYFDIDAGTPTDTFYYSTGPHCNYNYYYQQNYNCYYNYYNQDAGWAVTNAPSPFYNCNGNRMLGGYGQLGGSNYAYKTYHFNTASFNGGASLQEIKHTHKRVRRLTSNGSKRQIVIT